MGDLLDFKRVQIVSAPMAGANEKKKTELFGVAKSTISKVMKAFEGEEKMPH